MAAAQGILAHTDTCIALAFSATPENVEVFIAGVHEFLAEKGLGLLAFDIELLAREALVNAVQHGSKNDPARTVNASLTCEADRLVLLVSDEGPGWDWRSLPTIAPGAAEPPDPSGETGRGLFIIRKYADSFEYNEPGNALRIIKLFPLEGMNMETRQDSQVQLSLEPRLSALDAPALRETFRSRIQEGARRIVLDMARVESIDSVGIGLLVATHNSLAKQGGELLLVNVGKDIYHLLTLMRLDKHFSITPTAPAKGN